MTSLFFLWGFMTVFNDILIPRFKEAFTLTYFQAMLVQFAFFGAYFVGSLIYFVISITAGDPIAKLGYKNGVVIGLLISAMGGAILPPVQGFIAAATKNLQISFIVPLIAYAYVAFYGAVGHRIGRKNLADEVVA